MPPSYHEESLSWKPLADFFHLMGQKWGTCPSLDQKLGPLLETNTSPASAEENSGSVNKERGKYDFWGAEQ